MITLLLSAALMVDAPGSGPREVSYEQLLDCYGSFMVSKGLAENSPTSLLARWDGSARRACAAEIKKHKSLVGPKQFQRDWNGLWGEWWVRV